MRAIVGLLARVDPAGAVRLALLLLVVSLSACANRSQVAQLAPAFTRAADPPLRTPNGAIFQADTGQRGLFEDRRARRVGDSLTVILQERVTSSKQAATALGRNSDSELSVGQVTGLPLKTLQGLGFSHESSMGHNSSGSSSRSGNFTGTIAVTVAEVLPNGNLLVAGDKHIQINQGVERLGFSGVVNPANVRPDNSVLSTVVANVRLEYREEGPIGDNQVVGGLLRLFTSFIPLF